MIRSALGDAEAKAERIIAEELKRLKWKEGELKRRQKGDADKLAIAARLRRETTSRSGKLRSGCTRAVGKVLITSFTFGVR